MLRESVDAAGTTGLPGRDGIWGTSYVPCWSRIMLDGGGAAPRFAYFLGFGGRGGGGGRSSGSS